MQGSNLKGWSGHLSQGQVKRKHFQPKVNIEHDRQRRNSLAKENFITELF